MGDLLTPLLSLYVTLTPGDAAVVKLSCSPAHRRAVVLSAMSAQSSVEDTSSSIASRSRSVSPQRRHDDALLIGLSTGLFDANNPKVVGFRSLGCVLKERRAGGCLVEKMGH